jgi:nitroreductase
VNDCPAQAITIDTGEISEKCIHCGHCIAICQERAVTADSGEAVIPLRFNPVAPEDFRDLAAGIRTCRSYREKAVPEELLAKLVDGMKHYPSASNARPLHITVIRDRAMVQKLNDETISTLIRMFSLVTSPVAAPLLKIFAPSLNLQKLRRYKASFLKRRETNNSLICHHAPAVMLFHGPVTKTGMLEADANIWATYTSIYANTLGLGTCFNGFIVQAMGKKSRQNALFGLPAGHRVYACLLLGYPKVHYANECSRESPEVSYL